ncbi:DUF72 domain-containing protein [Sphingomonas cavernae]|uniref:DUF72 domain-containing protein n=1 Tax=Sphingomonas cavernae TaxID=2320861 RepID=A0A418WSC0_9SPHN|nr:DUF72 domain-containing protein [Sphingomonas cavernae]RJF94107.1 DUF72 domain-containing protein [Sphingomonas cavernae]
MTKGRIRVGIGGWTYEPWRGTFYPEGLPHARELEHAARRLGAIEINSTYYSLQKPESFRKWAAAAPADFVFAVKASRYCTNRKLLGEAGDAIERFIGQGLTELGDKLGPILWQFMPTKRFDPADFGAFLKLLPATRDGMALRHALEVRHESFVDPGFLTMARDAGAAVVFADKPEYPRMDEQTAGFSYARLQDAREDQPTGYDAAALDHWANEAARWASDGRDAFVFMINGAKVRAPAAAEALIARLAD